LCETELDNIQLYIDDTAMEAIQGDAIRENARKNRCCKDLMTKK